MNMALPMAGLASVLGAQPVLAQQSDATAPTAQTPSPTSPTTIGGDSQARHNEALGAGPVDPLANLEHLVQKGWITPVPTFDDTLTRDVGGWRSALASAGFGLAVYSINTLAYDTAKAGKSAGLTQELYNGQRFIAETSYQQFALTFDTSKIGVHGGQFVVQVQTSTNGYPQRNGATGIRLKEAYWYQELGKDKVELELGILTNATDYIGVNVGGSLAAGALGPQASIPAEVGQSFTYFGAPTASAKINWSKFLYTRTAIQRSITPQGISVEATAVPHGLGFGSPGARALLIQEIGYRIPSSAGVRNFWVRAGGYYNFSQYNAFLGGTQRNHAEYFAVDRQLSQPDRLQPGRGVYIGGTVAAAPGAVDQIARYYEGRVYWKGPLNARPTDMASFVADYNGYSDQARKAQTISAFEPFSNTQAYTGSYSFHVYHGFFLQPGVQAVVHPVFNRNVGTAINGLMSIVAFL